ncbi:MAG: hypothetical protein ACOCWJ_01230 [Verrucomicrobiota bacterium]
MVNATSISRYSAEWTARLTELGDRFGVVLRLVHRTGRRRAYLAGRTDPDVPMMAVHTWQVAPQLEAVAYADKTLPEDQQTAMERELANLCKTHNQ